MSNKNFSINGKGYYIALILCAAAIGISGYLYHQNTTKAQEVSLQEEPAENLVLSPQPAQTASPSTEATRPAVAPKPTKPAATVPTEAPAPVRKALKTGLPVAGEAIGAYAMDALSYNETTRDWRVHNGIDLAAEEGTEVLAAADGTVYTTYEDDALGYTVVIRHEGGYTTRYSNLTDTLCVRAGDSVKLGQPVGYVGSSALVETVMGGHVHFSVSYQDTPMAPEDFFALG